MTPDTPHAIHFPHSAQTYFLVLGILLVGLVEDRLVHADEGAENAREFLLVHLWVHQRRAGGECGTLCARASQAPKMWNTRLLDCAMNRV